MGFLSGSTSFERYSIVEDTTGAFGEDHLNTLEKFRVGAFKSNLLESPDIGFSGGSHLLDTTFDHPKNIIGDVMHFGIRMDSVKIPAPIQKAWMQMELAPLMDDPTARPTKSQREEAKEAVEARCEEEAANGNFLSMKETPILWDAVGEVLYIGGTSEKTNDSCVELLERAFDIKLTRITSGHLAWRYADMHSLKSELHDLAPAQFLLRDSAPMISWWNGMAENFDYLGNEFLLWLWWYMETQSDTISLSDGTEVAGMFARTLMLDCPYGESGKESISSDSPVALPEAALAIRHGKLPRKAGLTLVREGTQYDLTVQAETMAINGARISRVDETKVSKEVDDRINNIRELGDTVDLLFSVFAEQRIGKNWSGELKQIVGWLQKDAEVFEQKAAA